VTSSFAVDHKLWKLDPRPYHIENTILHSINAILVYAIVFLLLSNGLAAFLCALIFAIHPVQTQAVAWISGRATLLSMAFFLAAFLFHIRNRIKGASALNYSLLLVFFTFGLLSKEMAISLTLVLITYDLFFHARKAFKEYAAYYLPFFLISLFYLIARFSVLGVITQQERWWGGNIFYNMLTMVKAVAEYIRLLILPMNLGIEYSVGVPKTVLDKGLLLGVSLLSVIGILWFRLRRKKAIAFCIAWFFITMIPVYNIVPLKVIVAERFLYLPLFAFAVLLGIFFSNLVARYKGSVPKAAIIFAIVSIFSLYAFGTMLQNASWKDEVSLYKREVRRLPDNPLSHYSLGFAYGRAARTAVSKDASDAYYALAIKEFNETLRLGPEYYLAYFAYTNLGDIYNQTGQRDRAVDNFKKAKAIKESRDSNNNIVRLNFAQHDYGEALKNCKAVILQDPGSMNAYINLGNVYLVLDERLKAKRAYFKAARLGSGDPKLMKAISEL
jgi:tetratricopeptide (TPR) repeat protein